MTEPRNRGSPRLRFSKEELENPKLAQKAEKAEQAADRYDAAKKKLQTRRLKLIAEEVQTEQDAMQQIEADAAELHEPASPSGESSQQKKQASKVVRSPADSKSSGKAPAFVSSVTQATAEAVDASSPHARKKKIRLQFEETEAKPPSRLRHPVQRPMESAHDQLHQQLAEANEDDNAAVSAVLQGDRLSTSALQRGEHAYHAHKLRPYKQAQNAERALDEANIRYLEAKHRAENPQFTSNPLSRWQQKRAIRREYAAMKAAGDTVSNTGKSTAAAGKTVRGAGDVTGRMAEVFQSHPSSRLIILLCAMLLILMGSLQSCTPLAQSVLESLIIGTYPATEDDVRAAERAYAAKERELQDEMDRYEQYHPGYDEYHVDADEIWHDPYVLIAIISAYFDGQEWTLDTAYPVIEKYFNLQYVVTQTVSTETRYRTETRTGTRIVTDPVTGQQHTEMYTYDVQVPYAHSICNVKLENKNLSHLPVISMSHHTMGMYALYMASHGNMEGIFSGNPYAVPLRDPTLYDIPQETLDADPSFAALMEEATKYIGYPYVWGGASPETSFDCSGFVSYVFTNSGVYNTGRLGAKGLRSLCRTVPDDQAQPGDIVFFEGTMGADVAGITHCGIYVGNGMMLHCGNRLCRSQRCLLADAFPLVWTSTQLMIDTRGLASAGLLFHAQI